MALLIAVPLGTLALLSDAVCLVLIAAMLDALAFSAILALARSEH